MEVRNRENDGFFVDVSLFPISLFQFFCERSSEFHRQVVEHELIKFFVSTNGRFDVFAVSHRGISSYSLDEELPEDSGTEEIRSRIFPVDCMPGFRKQSKQVQLPDPSVKSAALKLLDEVSVRVFEPVHHSFHDAPCW